MTIEKRKTKRKRKRKVTGEKRRRGKVRKS